MAWEASMRELEEQRRSVRLRKKGQDVKFLGGRKDCNTPQYEKLLTEMHQLHSALNRELYRYTFRPRVTYYVATELWHGGMVPDNKAASFEIKLNDVTISEGDAALALVRLDLVGEINRVRQCENCSAHWLVGRKNYRFCSGQGCREAYYAKDPKFLHRKALNQRSYRNRLKARHSQY